METRGIIRPGRDLDIIDPDYKPFGGEEKRPPKPRYDGNYIQPSVSVDDVLEEDPAGPKSDVEKRGVEIIDPNEE